MSGLGNNGIHQSFPSGSINGTALASAIVTGILTGGEVTINADPAKYDVAAGTGVIINWTVPSLPTKTLVSWTEKLAVSPPDASLFFTVNGIDINGDLVHGGGALNESGVLFTDAQERGIISLQTAPSLDGVNISTISGSSRPAYEDIACIIDWVQTHDPLTSGNTYDFDTSTTITKATGSTSGLFINRSIDPQSPTTKNNASIPTVSAGASYQDGVGGFTIEVPATPIVLDKVDDGSGTLLTMTNNKFAIRRIIFFGQTEFTSLTYGQVQYNSIAEAKAAIFTEDPIINPQLSLGAFTTALIHKKGADLTNITEAEFVIISTESVGGGVPPPTLYSLDGTVGDARLVTLLAALTFNGAKVTFVGGGGTDFEVQNSSAEAMFQISELGSTVATGRGTGANQTFTVTEDKLGTTRLRIRNTDGTGATTAHAELQLLTPNGSGYLRLNASSGAADSQMVELASETTSDGIIIHCRDDVAAKLLFIMGVGTDPTDIMGEFSNAGLKLGSEGTSAEILEVDGNVKVVGQAYEAIQTTLVPGAGTETIDWNNGNFGVVDLASATGDVTLTLDNPNAGGFYFIKFIQDAVSPRDIIWPGSVLWPDGTPPVISTGASAVDTVSLAFDGTSYYGNFAQNYS